MKNLSVAFSSCPNDTFIFYAMLHNLIDTYDFIFSPHIHDVDYLNKQALKMTFDVSKLSFYTYLKLKKNYNLLSSGSALGYGCGPLLVTGNTDKSIEDMIIAIPGKDTTANLLLQIWNPKISKTVESVFDKIIPGVASGKYDAGLIIHEGRFIYQDYGLKSVIDLGQWWESETGLPIPLGCIAIKNTFGSETRNTISEILKDSVLHAFNNREASREYVRHFAIEMDDSIIDQHINLYVNDFTIDLGDKGREAVQKLEAMAQRRNLI